MNDESIAAPLTYDFCIVCNKKNQNVYKFCTYINNNKFAKIIQKY